MGRPSAMIETARGRSGPGPFWETCCPLLGATVGQDWRPGIGDPTIVGWLTAVAYVLAAVTCARAARRGGDRGFWWLLAGLLLALGVNKQLDLQTWLTVTGRQLAHHQGGYDRRGTIQVAFIAAVAAAAMIGLGLLARLARGLGLSGRLALTGMAFLAAFVLIRAASFHHVDRFLGLRLAGLRWNWIIELSAIALVAAAACRGRRLVQSNENQ
jgi:hypothetical protein